MSHNMHEHGWILLNVPKYAWMNCFDYANNNNIIIFVAIVIILEFLSAIIFLTWVRTSE